MNKREKIVQQQFLDNEEAVIKRLKQVYNQSLKDIEKKTQILQNEIWGLQAQYEAIEDEKERARLKSMQQSKIYQKGYQDALKKQIGSILDNMQVAEFTTVSEYLQQCYEDGFIGVMYDLHGQDIPVILPMDQEAMVRAVQIDSKISQGLYERLGEDVSMLKKKITAQVSRGISTGMTFEQVALQLAAYTNIGFNNAVRITRTEGHRIQVQSAMDACYKAKEKGADVVKQWDSSMDRRTRPSHQKVDGEIRELDEPFSNGLMYPGDSSGGASEVVNCRCALLQRAKWAMDEQELATLKERAEYYELDKSDNFKDFKKKYLKAVENEKQVENIVKKVDNIVEGQNIVGDWQPSGEYEHVIDDVIHSQGYDGLPKVVPYEEFKEAMGKSNFYAERTYSAETQELLDEYREQLYKGKFYVDCSTGGAQYGQGMYCAASYDIKDSKSMGGIGWEMSHYQEVGVKNGRTFAYTEAITLQPNAKIFEIPNHVKVHDYISDEYRNAYILKHASSDQIDQVKEYVEYNRKISNLKWDEDDDYINDLYEKRAELTVGIEELLKDSLAALEDTSDGRKFHGLKNEGVLVAEMGYDAINAVGHGESGSYTVILNRTKVIFCEGGSIYDN